MPPTRALLVALAFLAAPRAGALAQSAAPLPPYVETAATVETPAGALAGTLLRPAAGGIGMVVLLIAGSGPTDRNGNSAMSSGGSNSLRLLAEALAGHGIASLRYDKRGVAGSAATMTSEAELRFETYVEDAAAWLRKLRADTAFRTVAVVGHSEGALVGALAAERVPVDAVVSLAGPARRISDVLREQLRPQLAPRFYEAADGILRHLERGETVDSPPAQLFMLFRPSVQPYLASWVRYDPAEVMRRLSVPTLAIFGTTDRQVAAADTAVLAERAPRVERLVVAGMSHALKVAEGDAAQRRAANDPSLPLAPGLVDGLVRFLTTRATPAGASSRAR